MSDTAHTNGIAITQFQARFGAAPGSLDPKAECAHWLRLCEDLLAERARLRAELEKIRLEQILREWEQEPVPSWEEMQKQIDRSTSLDQIIAEMKKELEAGK